MKSVQYYFDRSREYVKQKRNLGCLSGWSEKAVTSDAVVSLLGN